MSAGRVVKAVGDGAGERRIREAGGERGGRKRRGLSGGSAGSAGQEEGQREGQGEGPGEGRRGAQQEGRRRDEVKRQDFE